MVTSRSSQRRFFAYPSRWYLGCALFAVSGYFFGSSQGKSSLSRFLEEATENEDESLPEKELDLTVMVWIVVLLIFLTVAFEAIKEFLEEEVNADMKIILEKLFGELTVLGFLAMVTFIITTTGYFSILSEYLFGEKEELLEYFELIHFSIFFIMIFFVGQVIVLVNAATQTEKEWTALDRLCRISPDDSITAASVRGEIQSGPSSGNSSSALMLFLRNNDTEVKEDELIFKALRSEFILERSSEAPFKPVPEANRIENDFNFGRYLSLSLTFLLTRVVEVRIVTWLFFVVGTLAFYGLDLLLDDNIEVLAWIWVGIGWMVFIFNMFFEYHLIKLRAQFLPKDTLQSLQQSSTGRGRNSVSDESLESSMLLQTDETETEHLPAWCGVDLEHFVDVQRPWLSRRLVGGKPNRLQVSFWFDRHGQRFYLLILQMNLIFLGVYAALTLLAFLPVLKDKYGPFLFTVYVILATVPGLCIIYQKKHLVATLAIVCSIGSYRKPQIVSDVLREKKTIRAVSTFIVIAKMRQFAESLAKVSNGDGISISIPLPVARPLNLEHHTSSSSLPFTTFELAEVGKTFDMIDEDRSGFLTHDEFGAVFGRMGAHLTPQTLEAVVAQFDKDGDGQVAREEFLLWYSDQMGSEILPPREQAKKLFRLFDSDSNGEITIGEFKNKVDALHLDFTVDDIGAIVNELDRDRTGSVSVEEFEKLFEKYTSET